MAKKKDKQAKVNGAKAAKLPKHVAGFKVPKDLRKSGAKLIEAANSPVGRQVLAAGMTALAAAAAARSKPVREAAANAAETTADTAKVATDAGMTQAGEIVDALANAAGAALLKMFEKKA